jgi:hypothetical protein
MKMRAILASPCLTLLLCAGTLFEAQNAHAFFRGKDIKNEESLPTGFVRFGGNTPSGIFHCSATKIQPHVFLTAAHCVDTLSTGDAIRIYSHEDSALKASEGSLKAIENHNVKIATLQQQYDNGEIDEATALAEAASLEKKLKAHGAKKLSQWYASAKNPIVKVYSRREYDSSASGSSSIRYDVAIIVTQYDPEYVKSARIDLNHRVSQRNSYMMVGHDRLSNDYTKNYKYEITSKYKTRDSAKIQAYNFSTAPGKGRVTQGDSGGGLYRYNTNTQRYDTVIGVTSAITKAFNIVHTGSYFAPIHNSLGSRNGTWIQQRLQEIEKLELSNAINLDE